MPVGVNVVIVRKPRCATVSVGFGGNSPEVVALALRDDSVDTLLDLLYVAHLALGADLYAVRDVVAGVDKDRPRDSNMG